MKTGNSRRRIFSEKGALSFVQGAVLTILAVGIGFAAIKGGKVYHQKAMSQIAVDAVQKSMSHGVDSMSQYWSQIMTQMDQPMDLDAMGLASGSTELQPVMMKAANGWMVATGIFIHPPYMTAYLAEEVDAGSFDAGHCVVKTGKTYCLKDPSMTDPKTMLFNAPLYDPGYSRGYQMTGVDLGESMLRDFSTSIQLRGVNSWGGIDWPVSADNRVRVTFRSGGATPPTIVPPSNDCSDLTGVDLDLMTAVCSIVFPGSELTTSGTPEATGKTLDDGTAEAVCCACPNSNPLVDGCIAPPSNYIGSPANNQGATVPNPVFTPAPQATCPPPYEKTDFCASASAQQMYCIKCHPNPAFASYCGRCITDRTEACTTCRAHCSPCPDPLFAAPGDVRWFYRGMFPRRCWVPEQCPMAGLPNPNPNPNPSPNPDGDKPNPNPSPRPSGPITPSSTPCVCPIPGVDCKGRTITPSGIECAEWVADSCKFVTGAEFNNCTTTCAGGGPKEWISNPDCKCVPCTNVWTTVISIFESAVRILIDVASPTTCAGLGGTEGSVISKDGTDYNPCWCGTGWTENGCTGDASITNTLENEVFGIFTTVDGTGAHNYLACQDIGGKTTGGDSAGSGSYCTCPTGVAPGATDCSSVIISDSDYDTACTNSGGVPVVGSDPTCDFSATEAACTGGGGVWNSAVAVCEGAPPPPPPLTPAQLAQEACFDAGPDTCYYSVTCGPCIAPDPDDTFDVFAGPDQILVRPIGPATYELYNDTQGRTIDPGEFAMLPPAMQADIMANNYNPITGVAEHVSGDPNMRLSPEGYYDGS